MSFRKRFTNYLGAAYPCVAVQTTEETRAMSEILDCAKKVQRGVFTWSATEGVRSVRPKAAGFEDTQDLVPALACLAKNANDAVIVLRDVHTWPFDRDPVMARAFRDLVAGAPKKGSTVVVLGPEFRPHNTVERLVTILDFDLPTLAELEDIARKLAESCAASAPNAPAPEVTSDVVRAMSGLTTTEAENALSLSWVETDRFDPGVVYREKVAAVRRTGLLEVIEADPRGLDAIGGLDELKAWIQKRKGAFTENAAKYGLRAPRGIALVGVPGGGKSLAAKCIGTALNCPTLRLDIGALFNSLVGESEARTRDALKLAEALAPCVLFADEIDKGLAGSMGSSGDGGVTRRVLGTILTWMQEKTAPVFVVGTMNQIDGLPPELLRKGRWDELFAVDLPDAADRVSIFEVHITKRNRNPKDFDLLKLGDATDGFTGAEIESVIDEAMFDAFANDARPWETQDLVNAAQNTTPLSVTAKEQIDAIRAWGRTRARFASRPREDIPVEESGPKRRLVGVMIAEDMPPAEVAKGGN